jgi:cytochrome c biogenesis protein CcmG/thiol:disulfide interchange protein DsbE
MRHSKSISVIILLSVIYVHAGNFDFTLPDLRNKRQSYSELKGENLTVLDFWATWCKPCQQSIPKIAELYDLYHEKGVAIIGISVDSPRNLTKVKPVSEALGINYPVLLDSNNELMGEMQVMVVPTLLILNSQDEIVYRHQGYRPGDEKVIAEELDKLLEKTKSDE